jgi:hypothetical protein
MTLIGKLIALTKQLYPTGRAFKMPDGGAFSGLHNALAQSEARAYDDAMATLYAILPDNDNFTAADATQWERRLGLISNEEVSLADRKAAIKRKLNFPGEQPARQHWTFLQAQLRLAGFDVYVHENTDLIYPNVYNPSGIEYFQHGDLEHGAGAEHGYFWTDQIVNSIDPDKDKLFNVGSNLRSTFYICGSTLGAYASIDEDRKTELRQLILRLKPAQTVGFLLINYT